MALNTLYPPIVDTYMPAFEVDTNGKGTCRIFFSISKYNELAANDSASQEDSKIRSIWVSITDPKTNLSMVNTNVFKSGLVYIYSKNIGMDSSRVGEDKYYIDIPNNFIVQEEWNRGQVYKIQLRFCSAGSDVIKDEMNWPVVNSYLFSEWSTVCLLQGILPPTVQLKGFDSTGIETRFGTLDNLILGSVSFDKEDNDFLNFYSIKLYKQNELDDILFDSGTVYTSNFNPNSIYYQMQYVFEDGVRYTLKLNGTTDKLYSFEKVFDFFVLDADGGSFKATIAAEPEDTLGRMKISVTSNTEVGLGNYVIKRASSKTNFTSWEDIKTIVFKDGKYLNFTWYDYTIESGVWYKYCIQKRDKGNNRSIAIITEKSQMALFNDMFLVGKDNQQLKLKFNPQVSTYSYNVLESTTQTIGSKYPFVKRNGAVNYRTFSISGLISYYMDEERLFATEEELYDGVKDLYQAYNDEHRIGLYNDFTLERTFREKVLEFLQDGEVKLFKSATEGNILITLTGVSFSPEQQLGRMLYSFNAQAVEIDDLTISNLDKYNIQPIGAYDDDIYNRKLSVNRAFSFSGSSLQSTTVKSLTKEIYDEDVYNYNNIIRELYSIDKVSIQFETRPYLIYITDTAAGMVKAHGVSTTDQDKYKQYPTVLGYLIKIGNKQILVGENGQYQIEDVNISENIEITLDKNGSVSVDVDYTIAEKEDITKRLNVLYYYNIIGQEDGVFYPSDRVISDYIYLKHNISGDGIYEKLYSLDDLEVEANPNTVFYLQNNVDSSYQRFMVGDTGTLVLGDVDYFFTDLSFSGIHLFEKQKLDNNRDYVDRVTKNLEYENCTKISVPVGFSNRYAKNVEELEKTILGQTGKGPRKNGVYLVSSLEGVEIFTKIKETPSINDYDKKLQSWLKPQKINAYDVYFVIYYNENWHLFINETKDVLTPVYASLTYYGEKEKGETNEN